MSASVVPTVTRRSDGTYAVPVGPRLSLVWALRTDGDQPVLTVKVEREGCKTYHSAEVDSVTLPVKL
jgi:hypothetical protein